jgi:dTDP-glucose 4,6-dehydratase
MYSYLRDTTLGSIHPTRDFNYVKDTVDGFIAISESPNTIGEEINISSQQEISVGELAREIIDQINPTARIVCEDIRVRPAKSEVERLLGSNEKIRRLTGWQPEYTLQQGIRETIEWFRDEGNLRRYKWNVYNV